MPFAKNKWENNRGEKWFAKCISKFDPCTYMESLKSPKSVAFAPDIFMYGVSLILLSKNALKKSPLTERDTLKDSPVFELPQHKNVTLNITGQ